MTINEYRQTINDVIIMLSEELLKVENDVELENMKAIDKRAAKYIADGMTKGAAFEKAGVEILTPIETAKRRAERESRRA
jgi:GTP:adenosylcobinamide-phosphate guanylyltransferase